MPYLSKTQWKRYDREKRLFRKRTKRNLKRVMGLFRKIDTPENRAAATLPPDVTDPIGVSRYGIPSGSYLVVYLCHTHPLFPLTFGQGWEFVHRLVARMVFGQLRKGWEVHHRDGNRHNNHPGNLMLIDPAGHAHLHKFINRASEMRIVPRDTATIYRQYEAKNPLLPRIEEHRLASLSELADNEHVRIEDLVVNELCNSMGVERAALAVRLIEQQSEHGSWTPDDVLELIAMRYKDPVTWMKELRSGLSCNIDEWPDFLRACFNRLSQMLSSGNVDTFSDALAEAHIWKTIRHLGDGRAYS